MASLGTELANAQADRSSVEGLMAFAESKMDEISAQLFAGLAGPFKYLESNPDEAGIDARAERMRAVVNDYRDHLLDALGTIADEIPSHDDICDLHADREFESYRSGRRQAAE